MPFRVLKVDGGPDAFAHRGAYGDIAEFEDPNEAKEFCKSLPAIGLTPSGASSAWWT